MRIKKIKLNDFKRFNDLTIDLSENSKKIVALVGPNGSGKSSVFDGFEEFSTIERARIQHVGTYRKKASYYKKSIFQNIGLDNEEYNASKHITIESDQDSYTETSFYIRSAHRFTPRIEVNEIKKLPDIRNDENRPKYLIDPDSRLGENYERLIGMFFNEVYDKEITGKGWSEKNISNLNKSLERLLELSIISLGNPTQGKGGLYFKKGNSERFPYENLSAGEKEVIDIIVDVYIKKDFYTNSVICIDEPELHLNTRIQRKLLLEVEKILPDDCQLWIATHSIGFLRAVQEDLGDKTTVIDFTDFNFDEPVVLKPLVGNRKDWMRIFETALDDLTGLLSPKNIIYCEGRACPDENVGEIGLDALVYNEIFSCKHQDALFVSSGGNDVSSNASLALKILNKAFNDVNLFLLKDRDGLSNDQREKILNNDPTKRILMRREIENYLFDKEILKKFCISNSKLFDESKYDKEVSDINMQELKSIQQKIQAFCGFSGNIYKFKKNLAPFITSDSLVYKELEKVIF